MQKMIETYWQEYHAGHLVIGGNARTAFSIMGLINSLSYDAYGLAIELGIVDDQPELRNWN